jgi:hypothetical protein
MGDVLCFHLLKLGNMELKSKKPRIHGPSCKKETLDIQTQPTLKEAVIKEKDSTHFLGSVKSLVQKMQSPYDTLFGTVKSLVQKMSLNLITYFLLYISLESTR